MTRLIESLLTEESPSRSEYHLKKNRKNWELIFIQRPEKIHTEYFSNVIVLNNLVKRAHNPQDTSVWKHILWVMFLFKWWKCLPVFLFSQLVLVPKWKLLVGQKIDQSLLERSKNRERIRLEFLGLDSFCHYQDFGKIDLLHCDF